MLTLIRTFVLAHPSLLGLAAAAVWIGIQTSRVRSLRGDLVDERARADQLDRDLDRAIVQRDQYAAAGQTAHDTIVALEAALDQTRRLALEDSLRLVAERAWWAATARKSTRELEELRDAVTADSTLAWDALFPSSPRSWW